MTPWLTFLTTWLKGGLHVENFSNNSVLNFFFCLSFRYLLVRARVKHFSINFLKLWGFLLETFQKSAKAEIFEKYCHTEFNAFYRFDLSFSLYILLNGSVYVCLYVCLPASYSVFLFLCLSLCLSVCHRPCLSVYRSICLFAYHFLLSIALCFF